MWHNLQGEPGYAAGAAGTVTVPSGGCVLLIIAHASAGAATLTIFGGASIPIINGASPTVINYFHTLYEAGVGGNTVVFTNTDQYFVHWVKQGHVQ